MLSCYVTNLVECLYDGDAKEVQVPGTKGSFGVLPGHEKFISGVDFGKLSITDPEGKKSNFIVRRGAFQVVMDRVIIVLDFGVNVDDIDSTKAQELIDHDKDRLKELHASDYDDPDLIEHIESRLEWHEKLLKYTK
ncbi:MAG: ATP synthase F1 subunit epsilon [Eggerthellaceae bacterium]|nr:ATP synthase F1 subunit epsilon [Eggerthellaceae bacterium]